MLNVLVTGSNGQLGKCLKDLEPQFSNINFIYTDYLELDITNIEEIKSSFRKQRIDYCVNCAAYTDVDKAESDLKKAFNINANGAKNLALVCKNSDSELIHISTDFVFDGNTIKAYSEEDLTHPISVYGKSKIAGEQEIIQILENHFIIRTSWLYSEYGNNFMKTMLRLSKEKDELYIVNDQIGTPTYAKDLAKVILEIINTNTKHHGIYHYSNEGKTNWCEFAKTIFELSNIDVKVNPISTIAYPTPAKRPLFSVLDKSKIKEMFNVEVPFWKDSLKIAMSNLKKW